MGYLLRRVASGAVTIAVVAVLSFALMEAAPGEFFDDLRLNPRVAPETIEVLRAQYGLTEPAPTRLLRWLAAAATGNLGFSLTYQVPVGPLLWTRAGNTLLLTVPALLIAWTIAVLLGLWTAARKRGWTDRLCDVGSSALLAIPDLLLILVLLLIALRTGWVPAGGMSTARGAPGGSSMFGDVAVHMLLPVAALVLGIAPMVLRHVRASAGEAFEMPAIRAARGHGIRRSRLTWRYVLPLAANPLISLAGYSAATLLSASLLIEAVLGWPGLGPLLLDAVLARDVHLVMGATVLSTLLVVAGNLLADVALLATDARMRPSYQER